MNQFDAILLKSLDEFMEYYKTTDTEHIYSNGTEFVPIFRVKQWCEYNNINKLQSNWNSLKEIISGNRRMYEDSNKSIEDSYKILNCDLPPRYYMNDECIEMIDYLLDKMNELEGKDK